MSLADDVRKCETPYDFRVLGDIVGSAHGKSCGRDYETGCVLWLKGLQLELLPMDDTDEKLGLQALFNQHYALSEQALGKDPFYALYVYAQTASGVRKSALV